MKERRKMDRRERKNEKGKKRKIRGMIEREKDKRKEGKVRQK